MTKSIIKSIGILGGSFDPPHRGHFVISKISLKKLKLKILYWIVTKKNPFKKKSYFQLKDRINKCKKIIKKNKKIKIENLENKIKSNRTIKVINYLNKRDKNSKIYLIIGSDNLINFHKWRSWKKILKICKLVVFSRKGFDKKAKKSVINKYLKNNIIFINKKVNISSTELRRNYQKLHN